MNRSHVAVQTIKTDYANTNPLVIGYIPTILQSFLGQTLKRFGIAYPEVAVRLQEMPPSEQVRALRNGAIDIAFMGNPPDELDEEFTVISCPVDYAELGVGNIQQLREKTFNQLMFPTRQRTREGFYYG